MGFFQKAVIRKFQNTIQPEVIAGAILLNGEVVGVIELKGMDVTDLSRVENQAFGYKNNQQGCRYVIISNFEKLRFYIDNAIDHIEFNLFNLDIREFELLWLCLSFQSLQAGLPARMKEESLSRETEITRALYRDYSLFKRELHKNLTELNQQFDTLTLFRKSQKLSPGCSFSSLPKTATCSRPIRCDWCSTTGAN